MGHSSVSCQTKRAHPLTKLAIAALVPLAGYPTIADGRYLEDHRTGGLSRHRLVNKQTSPSRVPSSSSPAIISTLPALNWSPFEQVPKGHVQLFLPGYAPDN